MCRDPVILRGSSTGKAHAHQCVSFKDGALLLESDFTGWASMRAILTSSGGKFIMGPGLSQVDL